MNLLRKYSKFLDVIEKIIRVVLIALMGLMALILFFQAVMRYVFSNPQSWCEELAVYMVVYCVMLGICIATRRESHLQVDFLLSFCSVRIKCLITAISSIVAIVVMIFFCSYSLSLMQVAVGRSTTLPITMREIYLVFPVGSILLILFSVENIAKNLFAFKNNGVFPAEEGGQVK